MDYMAKYEISSFDENELGGRSNFSKLVVELNYSDKKHFEALSMIKLAEGAYCEINSSLRFIKGIPHRVVTKFICRDLVNSKVSTYKLLES